MATDALQKQREKVEKLRQQVFDAQAAQAQSEQDSTEEVQMAALVVEEARLAADLAIAKASAKASATAAKDNPVLSTLEQNVEDHKLRALAVTDPAAAAKESLARLRAQEAAAQPEPEAAATTASSEKKEN